MQHAAQELKGDRFKLWMYLSKNKDSFKLDLSPSALAKWGIKKDTYYRAVEDLTVLGYLTEIQGGNDEWIFNEYPQLNKNESASVKPTWDF